MRSEYSCGIVPFRRKDGKWEMLLVFSASSHYWGFPKGHGEGDESYQQTACRELFEETALEVVRFLSDTPIEEHYHCSRRGEPISKTVFFFPAEVAGDVRLQAAEIADHRWVTADAAEELLTYPTDKHICRQAVAFL